MSEPAPVIIPIRGDTGQLEDDITNAANRAGGPAGASAGKKFVTGLGVGLSAGGAGLEKFARSTQETTLQLQRVAVATGLPRDALRDLAAETSNAGFATNEVIDTFEALSKQGLTSQADLQRVANVWDSVADATGGDAAALAKGSTALAAFGISAKNPEKALNAFGAVAFHTKDGIDGFNSFLEKQGPKLAKYGISVDDIATSMVALNAHGLSGKKAQTAFATAVDKSGGNVKKALATLGVGGAEFDKFSAQTAKGSEALDESAAAADGVLTPIQKLEAGFQALLLKSGKFGVVAGQLAPILVATGGGLAAAGKAAAFFDTSIGQKLTRSIRNTYNALRLQNIQATFMAAKAKVLAIATRAWAVAQRILNFAMRGNPIARVALVLIALGTALVIAYKKSETFRKFVQAAFAVIKTVIGAVVDFIIHKVPAAFKKIIDGITSAWKAVAGFFKGLYSRVAGFFSNVAGWLLGAGKKLINGLFTGIKFFWNVLWTWYVKIPVKIIGFFASAVGWLLGAGKRIITGLWNGLKSVWATVFTWFTSLAGRIINVYVNAAVWLLGAGKRIITGLWNGARAIWSAVIGWFQAIGSKIINALGAAGSWLVQKGRAVISGLRSGIVGAWNTVTDFLGGIGDKLIGLFSGAGRWLVDVGGDILGGLFRGLENAASGAGGFIADVGRSVVNSIIDGLNNVLDLPWDIYIPLPVVPDIGPFTILPHIPHLATGGLVNGSGTGTSDSIDAKVSDGEYVVRAKATKEWLPLLDAINWGGLRPGELFGGGAATEGASGSAGPTTIDSRNQVINQNYYGPNTSAGRRRELEWTLKYATK